MRKKVLVISADHFACGHYRILEPYRELIKQNPEDFDFCVYQDHYDNNTNLMVFTQICCEFDIIVFQRVNNPNMLAVIMSLKNAGKYVIIEIDDDLINISALNPAKKVWGQHSTAIKSFLKTLQEVNAVHVSTPELKDLYSQYSDNIHVFHNAINFNKRYVSENSRRHELPMDKIIIQWAGSSTHLESLLEICGPVSQVIKENPNTMFALCSNEHFLDMFKIPKEQKIFIPPTSFEEYYNICSMADIGITPVKLDKFNDSKSELKCLEYGAWGVPVVSSPVAPYKRFNETSNGANLVSKKNRPIEWIKNLKMLIDQESFRLSLGEQSRQIVMEKYNLQKINQKRLEYFRNIK